MYLRQSTASQEIKLGPFLDSTDGVTPMTALTVANTDIKLTFHGTTAEASKNSGGATHIASGRYGATLDATDTATLGNLEIDVAVSGALPVHRTYTVLPANVFDSLILGTDTLDVQVTGMGAGVVTAAAVATGAIDADAIATDAVTEIQSGLATSSALATVAGYIDTEIADIQSRLPAALVSGRIDASVGAMAANVITAAAMATDAGAEIATAVLTTQMTESYAADGTAPTLAQAQFLTMQSIGEVSISGTTMTVKRLNGSTTAATYTLDDATTPTSRTRAS